MIAIIGGTGLYRLGGLQVTDRKVLDTPFGAPSAPVVLGMWEGRPVAFLARHGETHSLLPGEVNYRANIWALKHLGIRRVIGVSAVGSLVEHVAPSDLAIATQYLDFTAGRRVSSFFGEGLVAHVSTAQPACAGIAESLARCASGQSLELHRDAVYACIAGPRLGTRAESNFLRIAGAQLVGMTNVPEAFLAREAQICYCTVAIVTDFDCWQEDPAQHVSAAQAMQRYRENLGRVQRLLAATLQSLSADAPRCVCRTALEAAVLTPQEALTPAKRSLLDLLRL